MALKNCSGCGKLIGETPSGYCETCKASLPEDGISAFNKVRDFLYDNPGSHPAEVSSATGVSIPTIMQFVREGRLEEYNGLAESGIKEHCACGAPLVGISKECSACTAAKTRQQAMVRKTLERKSTPEHDAHTDTADKIKTGFRSK